MKTERQIWGGIVEIPEERETEIVTVACDCVRGRRGGGNDSIGGQSGCLAVAGRIRGFGPADALQYGAPTPRLLDSSTAFEESPPSLSTDRRKRRRRPVPAKFCGAREEPRLGRGRRDLLALVASTRDVTTACHYCLLSRCYTR